MLSSPTAISASISSSALANTSLTLKRMPWFLLFSGANHSQVPSESLMKLEPDLGILGFPSFPVGWSRFWLFFPTDNSTAIICLVYPWGIFTAYRLKFMTADQVSHTHLCLPGSLVLLMTQNNALSMWLSWRAACSGTTLPGAQYRSKHHFLLWLQGLVTRRKHSLPYPESILSEQL